MRNKGLLILFFKIIPKGFISRIFGYFARIRFPGFFLNILIKRFCNIYKVNQDEISYPESGFKNFDQFFTRRLKPGVHKIYDKKDSIVSPVDSRIVQFGTINRYKIIQAKGIEYTIKDLIPSKMANEFIDGSYITLYLSPNDYHRIHSPADGKIIGYFHIPGTLFSVQEFIANNIKGLFTKNERVLSYIENDKGLFAVCKVGAMNVGRITLSYSADVEANKFIRKRREFFYSQEARPSIKKGAELGIFHLGSTVILLFQKGLIRFKEIDTGQKVRVGQSIASFI